MNGDLVMIEDFLEALVAYPPVKILLLREGERLEGAFGYRL